MRRNLPARMRMPFRWGRWASSPSVVLIGSLALISYAVAFIQRPGQIFTDTRIELTVDPVRFLHSVASVWSNTEDFGHVQSGQFVGYLAPMAPWYAFAHAIGIPTWMAERIWLGTLLAVAAWGMVRLMEALLDRRPGVAHAVAALLFIANPYVVVAIGRATVVLLAYAALPWLLLFTYRGVRTPRSWRAPAAIGLTFALTGGGVNAALLFWIALPPIALVLYEVLVTGSASWRTAIGFAVRSVVCLIVSSLWWVVPVLLQTRYGADFLKFTEQPFVIFATPSVSESLRLLGYWLMYSGVGPGPFLPVVSVAQLYLFNPWVIAASFLVPLFAFGGLLRTRRWAYAPFFMFVAVATLIIMSAGFPPGGPANRFLTNAYFHVGALQTLRTTWKATPLLAISLACLGGVAAGALIDHTRARGGLHLGRARIPNWGLAVLLALPVLWALPLFNGTAIEASSTYRIPGYWRAAARDATNATTPNQRIMVLPGELFGWYRWGGTADSIAPNLTTRPVLIRETTRWGDPRSSQLQTAVDDLVQQGRLVPGQLEPLLQLFGVGAVLVPTDGNLVRDAALDPARLAYSLRDQPTFARPVQAYGRSHPFTPPAGRGGGTVSLPDMRRYVAPSGPGVVRVDPVQDTTILDGDGNGIAELAADGYLNPRRAIVYAGDLNRRSAAGLVASGARLAFTDSNRLRIIGPTTLSTNTGPTLGAGDAIAPDTPTYNLFPNYGTASRTLATFGGLGFLRTTALHPRAALLPADAAGAAVDGRLDTGWVADPQAPVSQRYLELKLARPRPVTSIRLYPLQEQDGITAQVALSVNGGPETQVPMVPGWNTIPINSQALRTLRIRVAGVVGFGTGGGISEVQIPGLRVRESLRLPTTLASETAGLDLRHNPMLVLLSRTTADFPYREQPRPGQLEALSGLHEGDAEQGLRRTVTLPAARSFSASGWASVSPTAPDPLLDQLAGMHSGGWRFASSSRFEGDPLRRASSAFDGTATTAWAAPYVNRLLYPWIQWSSPRTMVIRQLRLLKGLPQYEFPAVVSVSAPGVHARDLAVSPDGLVRFGHPLRARTVRLQVLKVRFPFGAANFGRFLDTVAISEIQVPGLHPPALPRGGKFVTRCGALTVGAGRASLSLQVYGTVAALDQGEPLPLRTCGARRTLPLAAGTDQVVSPPGTVMRADHLALTAPAPAPLPAPPITRLASAGSPGQLSVAGVKPRVTGPAWLVLGQGYSGGWRAWCRDGSGHERALGAPTPIDGYANGWRIGPSCKTARMYFVPQTTVNTAYAISALAGLILLAVALGLRAPARLRRRVSGRVRVPVGVRRRLPRAVPAGVPAAPRWIPRVRGEDPLRIAPWPVTLGLTVLVGLVTAGVFAARFAVVAAPVTLVLLRVGFNARRLLALAALLIAAVPVLYLANPAHNFGGYDFDYGLHYLTAHWLAAGALCLLLAAAIVQASALRHARRPRPNRPPSPDQADDEPESAPEPRPVAPLPGAGT